GEPAVAARSPRRVGFRPLYAGRPGVGPGLSVDTATSGDAAQAGQAAGVRVALERDSRGVPALDSARPGVEPAGRLVRASDFGGQDSRSGFRSDAPPGARSAAAATGRGGRVAAMPGKGTRFRQIFLTHLRQVKGRLAIAAVGTLGATARDLLKPWPLKIKIGRASCR